MSKRLLPVNWKELVRKFKRFGFIGPFIGGRHPYMIKGNLVITIPNPHKGDIGVSLLSRILKQANINIDEWINTR
ncbi:MAG: type II toxin-antitoxin system HicA family toxin [Candidatus Melainabacteria bacterium]|nr:type II toxin-antitoxin system HicA family toxin [Candidatus Melainabacteria bacterium]